MAVSAAGLELLDGLGISQAQTPKYPKPKAVSGPPVSVEGCTLVSEFRSQGSEKNSASQCFNLIQEMDVKGSRKH